MNPMTIVNESAARPIWGDRLSCYTASIAGYMEACGVDHQLALGTQLFLALRCAEDPDLRLSFVHYHTPLLGQALTRGRQLARRWAADPETAAQRIAAECSAAGAVIVVGDAINLPWLVTYGRRHTPHWFLVAAIDHPAGKMRVVDRFEFIDEAGAQSAFDGWLDLADLGAFAQICPAPSHVFLSRDAWAFGLHMPPADDPSAAYQWFEAVSAPPALPLAGDQALGLLARTWMFHSGRQARDDLPAPEWACGLAAVRALAECFRAYLDRAELYAINDDVWVAARNRELFAHLLDRLGSEQALADLRTLSAWCLDQLTPQWHAIPRIMRYNLGSLQRGRRPTALLVETLTRIADLETELIDRLGAILAEARQL